MIVYGFIIFVRFPLYKSTSYVIGISKFCFAVAFQIVPCPILLDIVKKVLDWYAQTFSLLAKKQLWTLHIRSEWLNESPNDWLNDVSSDQFIIMWVPLIGLSSVFLSLKLTVVPTYLSQMIKSLLILTLILLYSTSTFFLMIHFANIPIVMT